MRHSLLVLALAWSAAAQAQQASSPLEGQSGYAAPTSKDAGERFNLGLAASAKVRPAWGGYLWPRFSANENPQAPGHPGCLESRVRLTLEAKALPACEPNRHGDFSSGIGLRF